MNDQPSFGSFIPPSVIDNRMRLSETFSNPETSRQYKNNYYNDGWRSLVNSDELYPPVNTSDLSLTNNEPNDISLQQIPSIPFTEFVNGEKEYHNTPSESESNLGFVIQQDPNNPDSATIYVPVKYKKLVIIHENRVEDVSLKSKRDRKPFTTLEKEYILGLYDKYRSLKDLTKKAIAEMIFRDVYINPSRDENIIKIRKSIKGKMTRDVQSVLYLLYNNRS